MTAGRSLRLLLAVGLALAVWLALRLPLLQRDLAALQAEPAPLLPQPAAGLLPVAMRAPPDVAVAAAEVAVAEAALALARAQLQLAQVRAGVAVAPLPSLAMAPPAYAPAAAPQRAYASPYPAYAPRLAPGWTLPLPAALPPQTAATPAIAATATTTTAPVSPAPSPGHDLATAAYARLATGDRRGAVALFDAALASDPVPGDAKLRPAWTAERRRLVRRWSADAYTLFRESGPAGPAASPVLGGGQSGGTLAWTFDPLARRPLALVARNNAASLAGRIDPATGQAAFGVRWQPVTGVSISAERLVSAGVFARDDWALRVAGGPRASAAESYGAVMAKPAFWAPAMSLPVARSAPGCRCCGSANCRRSPAPAAGRACSTPAAIPAGVSIWGRPCWCARRSARLRSNCRRTGAFRWRAMPCPAAARR